jgi:hypothetical protein
MVINKTFKDVTKFIYSNMKLGSSGLLPINNNFYITKMKKLYFPSMLVVALLLLSGCSKNNSKSNTNPATSEWSYHDTTFKGLVTGYDSLSAYPILSSRDSSGDMIYLVFNTRPTQNSTFTVVQNVADSSNVNPYVTISISYATSNLTYNSTGKAGDKLNATFVNGKLQATFSDITILSTADITTLSGTIIQNE